MLLLAVTKIWPPAEKKAVAFFWVFLFLTTFLSSFGKNMKRNDDFLTEIEYKTIFVRYLLRELWYLIFMPVTWLYKIKNKSSGLHFQTLFLLRFWISTMITRDPIFWRKKKNPNMTSNKFDAQTTRYTDGKLQYHGKKCEDRLTILISISANIVEVISFFLQKSENLIG